MEEIDKVRIRGDYLSIMDGGTCIIFLISIVLAIYIVVWAINKAQKKDE